MQIFEDRARVLEILTCPEIWDLVRNGREADPADFVLPKDWIYLTETGNEVFVLSTSHHVHPNILPATRHKAYWMCKRFGNWIFNNTDLESVFSNIHKRHQNAIKLSKLCGFDLVEIKNDRHAMVKRFSR